MSLHEITVGSVIALNGKSWFVSRLISEVDYRGHECFYYRIVSEDGTIISRIEEGVLLEMAHSPATKPGFSNVEMSEGATVTIAPAPKVTAEKCCKT